MIYNATHDTTGEEEAMMNERNGSELNRCINKDFTIVLF